MNKEVSFPIAKLLKEKGFDYHLLYNDFANEYDYFDRSVQGRIHVSDFPEDKFPDSDKWIPVPYISQVVMWLYEKHEYWCYAYTNGKIWHPCIQHKFGDMAVLSGKIGEFNSPTEAYSSAILYTLNNLI